MKFLFLLLASFITPALYAGTYTINSTNLGSLGEQGITYSVDGVVTTDATGFGVSGGSNRITFSGLSIKEKQSWGSMNVTHGSGTATISVQNTAGSELLSRTVNSTQSIDLSSVTAGTINIQVVFSADADRLSSIVTTISGYSLIVYPAPFIPSQGTLKLRYDIPNDARVTLQIFDNRGRLVKSLYENDLVNARTSPYSFDTWDGRNRSGQRVASGIYTAFVRVQFLNSTNEAASDYTSQFRFVVMR